MFSIVDAATEKGLSYREAFDMPLDELELFVYLSNARSERIIEANKNG
jgi:hypothetical protein